MQTTQTIIVCSKCGSDRVEGHSYDHWRCKDCLYDTQGEWKTSQRSWTDESDEHGRLLRKVMV